MSLLERRKTELQESEQFVLSRELSKVTPGYASDEASLRGLGLGSVECVPRLRLYRNGSLTKLKRGLDPSIRQVMEYNSYTS